MPRLVTRLIYLFAAVFGFTVPAFGIVIPSCDANGLATNQECMANAYTAGGSVFNAVNSDENLSGVVEVVVPGDDSCSGSLISPTLVLTAAHCAYGLNGLGMTVTFPDGTVINGTSVVDPTYANYSGPGEAWQSGADLAVVELATPAPSTETVYQLYTGSISAGDTIDVVGYGYTGTGATGQQGGYGTLMAGQNSYQSDGCATLGSDVSCKIFVAGFSDGQSANNPFNSPFLTDAVDISYGDSGGPSFYDGMIVGVHDIVGCTSDAYTGDPCLTGADPQGFYGELFGDTSVLDNITWIDSEIAASAVPEPSYCWLGLLGFLFAAVCRIKRLSI